MALNCTVWCRGDVSRSVAEPALEEVPITALPMASMPVVVLPIDSELYATGAELVISSSGEPDMGAARSDSG